jgi:carbon monoxide dehydrogenase subunit G
MACSGSGAGESLILRNALRTPAASPSQTYTTASGKLTFSATSKVEPTAEGTRFTYRVEAESGLGGVFGRMSDPVVTKALGRIIRANLGNLADLLER